MPSIQKYGVTGEIKGIEVLNLVISGMPSIPKTRKKLTRDFMVLNLVISGMPSILMNCARQIRKCIDLTLDISG